MPDRTPPILLPEVLGERMDGDGLVLELRVPESLAYFPGHFPGVPIVPGVVQLQWAVHLARERFELPPHFHHMEVVKFKELILPRQRLELHLNYHPQAGKLQFVFRTENLEYSSGRIYFHGNRI
jgi:3-hydroxymyristoyl/3-hydroxydecanoyl-(acyl carrier protein) dehydratase